GPFSPASRERNGQYAFLLLSPAPAGEKGPKSRLRDLGSEGRRELEPCPVQRCRLRFRPGSATMHDLVIRNARIADGLGNPLIEGDLAVAKGRVAEIGRVSGTARESFDAGGMVLAPGVIDVHTHY